LIAILLFQALLVAGLFAAALDGTRNLVQALQNAVVVYAEHPAIPHYRLSAFTRASAAERPGLAYRLTYWSVLCNAIF